MDGGYGGSDAGIDDDGSDLLAPSRLARITYSMGDFVVVRVVSCTWLLYSSHHIISLVIA
jgi:hypothetical protein